VRESCSSAQYDSRDEGGDSEGSGSALRESRFARHSSFAASNQMMRRAIVAVSCPALREGNMSTPLVTALRESCEYLRDGGYHQTAQLMTVAADEIERLNNQIRALEAARQSTADLRRPARTPAGLHAQRGLPFPSSDNSAAPVVRRPRVWEA
jgi:hypothetical protein